MTLTDHRGQDSSDTLVCVDVCISDVELATETRRSSESLHQSTVADGEQRQRQKDAQCTVQPDVDAHHTSVVRLQRPGTLDQYRHRRVRTRNGLDDKQLRDLEPYVSRQAGLHMQELDSSLLSDLGKQPLETWMESTWIGDAW